MIPQTDLSWQTQNWQASVQASITDLSELCRLLKLTPASLNLSEAAARQFPLKVPREFVALMQQGDPNDPLLRQVLAVTDEQEPAAGYSTDPLEEADANPLPGLIHKYKNRVLLTLTGACAVHCRYCFRRHFPYEENTPGRPGLSKIVDYLRARPEINEVILSGGDPLSAPDSLLHTSVQSLAEISTIRRLRVHTRFPVVIPTRITDALLSWLHVFPKPVMVLHINHPNEISPTLVAAVERLNSSGAYVLNQSVLLRGINDCASVQKHLAESCFEAGIHPYYLHTLDPVEGAQHFAVDPAQAITIYQQMQEQNSGYLIPTLVTENPGVPNKTRL